MKILKYIILSFLYLSLYISYTNAEDDIIYQSSYIDKKELICESGDYFQTDEKENPKIIKIEDYKSADELKNDPDFWTWFANTRELFPFEMAKKKYREDQNNIYKCWVLSSQKKAFELIKKLLKSDKTWLIKDKIEWKLDFKIQMIDTSLEKVWCNKSAEKFPSMKKSILDQSTYEMCKYVYYLDYLEEYYTNVANVLWINNEEVENFKENNYNVAYIVNRQNAILDDIKLEKEHTYKVYPIAFTAYSEYDNFLPIHIALEIIKEDFIVYRKKLYQTLNPINQVVYKIINAMSK